MKNKTNMIREFTTTELRRESTTVFQEIEDNAIAKIVHRDRDDMLLIKEKDIEWLFEQYCKNK